MKSLLIKLTSEVCIIKEFSLSKLDGYIMVSFVNHDKCVLFVTKKGCIGIFDFLTKEPVQELNSAFGENGSFLMRLVIS